MVTCHQVYSPPSHIFLSYRVRQRFYETPPSPDITVEVEHQSSIWSKFVRFICCMSAFGLGCVCIKFYEIDSALLYNLSPTQWWILVQERFFYSIL